MQWTVEQSPDFRFIRITTVGAFTVDDHLRMIDDILSRPFWTPGGAVFFDHRRLELGGANFEVMRAASENHLRNDTRIGPGKAAILMGSPAAFGSARQFEALVAGKASADMKIFLDEDLALLWLRS